MLGNIRTFIKNIGTGKDGETHDVIRWTAIWTTVTALGLTIYNVMYKGMVFDIQSFGIGMGAVFAAVGAALKLKETTEPEAKVDTPVEENVK